MFLSRHFSLSPFSVVSSHILGCSHTGGLPWPTELLDGVIMPRCNENAALVRKGEGLVSVPANCSFCGSQYPTAFELISDRPGASAGAYGKERIFAICEKCAIERLPKLIVEALSVRLLFENDSSGICRQVSKSLDEACLEVRKQMEEKL